VILFNSTLTVGRCDKAEIVCALASTQKSDSLNLYCKTVYSKFSD